MGNKSMYISNVWENVTIWGIANVFFDGIANA